MEIGSWEPAHDVRLTDVRGVLDEALVALRGIEDAGLDVSAAEESLGEALRHIYAALAHNSEMRRFRDETEAALERVRATLAHLMAVPSEDGAAAYACARVAKALGDLQRVRWMMVDAWLPRADRPIFARASRGLPQLLELSREVVGPGIPLEERPLVFPDPPASEVLPAPPKSLEEVLALAKETQKRLAAFEAAQQDEPPERSSEPELPPAVLDDAAIDARFGVAITTEALLVERASDCMDDLAMLGRMRRCTDPEPWASGEDAEARMLTKVDALAACGSAIFSEVVRLLDDRPLPDPELTFGNLFFFGSLAGDDAFDQMLRLIEVSPLDDPEMLAMVTDALVFAPTPLIDRHLPAWLQHEQADRRVLAAEVLRRRRVMTLEQFDAIGNDTDERVLASAARALPTLTGRAPYGALTWFLHHPSERVVRAALESAMRLRRPVGFERAVELVSEGRGAFADAILFVAIGGDESAKALIEREMASTGAPIALRAAGWFGDASFVPFLLGRLWEGDGATAAAALEALERISGASIIDASVEPTYAPKDRPFLREPRPYEPPGILDGDPDAWESWWKRWGAAARPGVRYRWGQRWRVADTLHELTDGEFLQRDRPWAAMELCARAGAPPHLDWTDWILRQRRAVDELARAVGARAAVDQWSSVVAGGDR